MPRPQRARVRTLLGIAAATGLLGLAACGSGDDQAGSGESPSSPPSSSAAADFPVTVASGDGEITLDSQPKRIVSLSPSATESLFAIGAGKQVVAADAYSTYPASAPAKKGLSGYDPNVEAILGYDPDLVIAANDANDMVKGLEAAGVPTLISAAPASIDEGYDNFALLGMATGHVDETAAFVKKLRGQIDSALAEAPKDEGIRVYHELDETHYAASSYGFVGSVYQAMGAENVADAADKQKSGYPQLTEEAVIKADPQLIVITDQVGYTAKDVAARPGWDTIAAVENGDIVTVDADISSRWGPRLPQFIDAVAQAMRSVPVGSKG